jgi:hypothetical protein
MEGFFYAKIEAFEVQVYSDSPVDLESDAVIYLGLSDEAYPRAELWFVDRARDAIPENRIEAAQTTGSGAFLAYFRSEKMRAILGLLRSHDNVWFTWDESRVAAIRAGREPTAETGEGAG